MCVWESQRDRERFGPKKETILPFIKMWTESQLQIETRWKQKDKHVYNP